MLGKGSMGLILDTHALLWMLLADPRLGQRRRKLIEQQAEPVFVSAVSGFEIATKVRIGKLPEAAHIAENFEAIFEEFDYRPLNITLDHCLRAGRLVGDHRDPFDRLIAGQALVEGMSVVSGDEAFKEFGVETVW